MSITHEFRNFDLLKKRPPDIKKQLWDLYLSEMDAANNFEKLDHPVQVDVELNSGCNMNCPFCLHGYEDIKNKNMPIKTYRKIIDEAAEIGVKSLKLNYINEPMLRKDLEDCIKYAKKAGIPNIYMATNGTLLNSKRRKSILESGITKIFISIDSFTSDTYNTQRLDGRFPLVIKNVTSLIDERNELGLDFPIIRVSFLKNSLNIHEAEDFEKFWSDKADLIAFQVMDEVPDLDTKLTLKKDFISDEGCQFVFKQLVITTDGNILPCCKMSGMKLKIGNIDNMSLRDAWKSKFMSNLQKQHAGVGWKDNKICSDCIRGK